MDFELFNDCPSSSDIDMSMSDSGVAGLLFSTGSSQPDSMMLSLEDHTLSSFDDGKQLPIPSSSSSSSDCFYYIPDLNSACSLVDAMKEDVIGENVDDKLFLKNEENGIWVLTDKGIQNNAELTTNLSAFTPSENYTETSAGPENQKKKSETFEITTTQNLTNKQSSPSPVQSQAQSGNSNVAAVLTGSKKRKSGITTNRSAKCDASLREEFPVSKTLTKNNEVKKSVPKVANCKIKPDAEKYLQTLADSVTQDLSKLIRQEIETAFNGLKSYLDEKLSQSEPAKKSMCSCNQRSQEEGFSDNSQNDSSKQSIPGGRERNVDHGKLNIEAESVVSESKSEEGNLNLTDGQSVAKPAAKLMETKTTQRKHRHQQLEESQSQSETHDIQLNENTEKNRIATVNNLLKYVTSPTLVETLKKSIENCNNDDDNPTQQVLNPVDVLNMSIGSSSPETEQTESNDTCSFPKFSLGIVKEEPFSAGEDESSSQAAASYLDLFSAENGHFLDMDQPKSQIDPKQETANLHTPTASASESCTALVPYVPPPSKAKAQTKTASKRRSKREQTLKPELSLRKLKKPLLCDICDRSFLNNSSLKQHMSFHQPQRPFQCEHKGCDKSYKTRSELNRHLIVHTGQKNYECRRCGKTFLRKQYLKTHLIRHNESLTWQCALCAKIFVSEDDLNKHKVSYHKKNGKRSSYLMIEQPQKLALSFYDDSLEA